MSTAEIATVTADDLLGMDDGVAYELVDGRLVEKPMSGESVWIGGELHARLRDYLNANPIGWTFSDGLTYQCFSDNPQQVRRPDVSFIRAPRLSLEAFRQGHIPVAPDLAVEVISPGDSYNEVMERVADFLAAGTTLVWVISPPMRSAMVHRPGRHPIHLQATESLTGEDVLPGFECRLNDILTPPLPPASQASATDH